MVATVKRLHVSSGVIPIFEAYQQDGIVLIEDFFTQDEVQRFMREVGPALAELPIGLPASGPDQDATMIDFSGEKTKRLRQLVARSPVFRHELLENELMHSLLEKLFVDGPMDGYWMSATEVIEITPGSKAQMIHRDQELYPAWNAAGSAMPEAVCNFITALTPFTSQNGATQVAPGTHKDSPGAHFLSSMGAERVRVATIPALMNPGDCIFFSGKILHGGGANFTEDESRCGLAMSFVRRILTPEEAHAFTIDRKIIETMSYRGQAMLGFRSQWPVMEKGLPMFYWSDQGSDIGDYLGLTTKPPLRSAMKPV